MTTSSEPGWDIAWDVGAMTACAVALRPQWDAREVTGALVAAQNDGWTARRSFAALARALTDPAGYPRDLLSAVQRGRHGGRFTPPNRATIAAARAASRSGGKREPAPEEAAS